MNKIASTSADKYDLYTQACQDVDAEISFVIRICQEYGERHTVSLREDFCGTAHVGVEWTKINSQHVAVAVDHSREPLQWCENMLIPALTPDQQRRFSIIHEDVRKADAEVANVILALNHSYMVFKHRNELTEYLTACWDRLSSAGVLILDLYGGTSAKCPGIGHIYEGVKFKAVWCQSEFDPITNEAMNRLHFVFPDGSELRNAFVYDWRLWSPAELKDALEESGFKDVLFFNKRAERENRGPPNQIEHFFQYDDFELYIVATKVSHGQK